MAEVSTRAKLGMGLEIGSRVSKVVVLVRVMLWGTILGVWLRIDLIARPVVGWKI